MKLTIEQYLALRFLDRVDKNDIDRVCHTHDKIKSAEILKEALEEIISKKIILPPIGNFSEYMNNIYDSNKKFARIILNEEVESLDHIPEYLIKDINKEQISKGEKTKISHYFEIDESPRKYVKRILENADYVIDYINEKLNLLDSEIICEYYDPEFLIYINNEVIFMYPAQDFVMLLWNRNSWNENDYKDEFDKIKPFIRLAGSKGKKVNDPTINIKTKFLDEIKKKDMSTFTDNQIETFNKYINRLYQAYNL